MLLYLHGLGRKKKKNALKVFSDPWWNWLCNGQIMTGVSEPYKNFCWKQDHTGLDLYSGHAIIGEGNGTPLQYSCLENPMDGGAWWAAKSRTRLTTSLSLSLHAVVYVCVYVPYANETLKLFMGIFQMKGMSWRLCCYSSWLVCSLILTFLSRRISIWMWISHINAPRDLKNYLTPFINCSILTDFLMSNHVSWWFSVFPSSLCVLIYENHLLEKVWPHSSA